MAAVITVEEAQAQLKDIIERLAPGQEFIITKNQQPVAKLIGQATQARKPRKAGSAVGKFQIVTEDDDHLRDFAEYMP